MQLQCKGNDTIAVVKNQIVPLSLMAHGIDLLAQMDQCIFTNLYINQRLCWVTYDNIRYIEYPQS